jgi:uncharacterized protein (DUF2236 family)
MIWTVDRETALLLGAGRALLLQLAHPLVAAGVAEHSRFAEHPFGRLFRTLATSCALVFGDREAAIAAMRRLEVVHHRVCGVLRESVGRFAAGTPYDATDPALRLWVHATLIDTSLQIYDLFVARLSATERAQYYADSCELAHALGVLAPATLDEFRAYVFRMLSTDIAVGATARALARLIFRPPGAVPLRPIGLLFECLTAGLLPPVVRAQYGYRWSTARQQVLDTFATAVKTVLPTVPPVIRVVPQARSAERRLRLQAPAA